MKTVAIDFDGVLHSYVSGWTGEAPHDPPTLGARAFCEKLRAEGYRVVVFTCRALTKNGRAATVAWLNLHRIPVDEVTSIKPHAKVYIDDRAHRFEGCWEDAYRRVTLEPFPATPETEPAPIGDRAPFAPTCSDCSVPVVAVSPLGYYAPCGHPVPCAAEQSA